MPCAGSEPTARPKPKPVGSTVINRGTGRQGTALPSSTVLWIIAAVIAVVGVIVLISGSVIWGIILLIVAALVGPGGYSIFRRRSA